jgi:hypothetical protein
MPSRHAVLALAALAVCTTPKLEPAHKPAAQTQPEVQVAAGPTAVDPQPVVTADASRPPTSGRETPLASEPPTSGREKPLAVGQPTYHGETLFCRRSHDLRCWDCAALDFPDEVPCADSGGCDGICLRKQDGQRCVKSRRVCCQGAQCEQPPAGAACPAECGDPNGDGVRDRCIVPSSCADRAQIDDGIRRYWVARPLALYEAVCGPLPAKFPKDTGPDAKSECGPAKVLWTIHPRMMAEGGGGSIGPGLCYGVVRVGAGEQVFTRCTGHHCETLRTCDGKETPASCSIVGSCNQGRFVPTYLYW